MSAGERFYEVLLRLYPAPFRLRYETEMVQLFGDQLRDARTAEGQAGVVATWFRAIGDLVTTAVGERLRGDGGVGRSLEPPPTPAMRLLGLIGLLGGAWFVAWLLPFVPWGPPGLNLRLAVFNLGAITTVIAYSGPLMRTAPRLSRVIVTIAVMANAWYLAMYLLSLGRPQPPAPDQDFRVIWFYAGVAFWWADAAFGVVALRLRGLARWGALALAVGSPFAFLGIDRLDLTTGPFRDIVIPLSLVGLTLNGVGWLVLGSTLVFRVRGRARSELR